MGFLMSVMSVWYLKVLDFGFQVFELRMPDLYFIVSVGQRFRNDSLGSSGSESFLGLQIRHWLELRWLKTCLGLQDLFLR